MELLIKIIKFLIILLIYIYLFLKDILLFIVYLGFVKKEVVDLKEGILLKV